MALIDGTLQVNSLSLQFTRVQQLLLCNLWIMSEDIYYLGSVPLQDVIDALPQPNGEHYIDRSTRPSTDSNCSSGETSKRAKFEEHRKAHYQMKDALARCACSHWVLLNHIMRV